MWLSTEWAVRGRWSGSRRSVVVGVLLRVLLSLSLDEDLVQTRGPEEANEGPHSVHASRGSVQTGKGQDGGNEGNKGSVELDES